MMQLFLQFIYALMATLGFSIIFRVPAKKIPICIIIGALGWISYQTVMFNLDSPIMSSFIASCIVGLLSDFSSRVFKEASTVFIIPGILCLVPGSGIYYTMVSLLDYNLDDFAEYGTRTMLMAGAIAVGLLIIGSVIRIARALHRKIKGSFGL